MVSDLMRVDEGRDIGQVLIMVDDVGEVDHSLVAFVDRWSENRVLVVDSIDERLKIGKLSRYPVNVLGRLPSDDQNLGILRSLVFRGSIGRRPRR